MEGADRGTRSGLSTEEGGSANTLFYDGTHFDIKVADDQN